MNCKELGYKVGDDFEMLEKHGLFEKGDEVTLCEDDGSNRPRFSKGETSQWVYLYEVRPLEKTMDIKEAYKIMSKNCGIKVGDTVKVLRRFKDEENGCNPYHTREMEGYIGKEGIITDVEKDYWTYRVDFDTDNFYYPFFVLEKIKDGVEPIELDGYTVIFKDKGSIEVGRQKLDWETVKEIYERAKSTR